MTMVISGLKGLIMLMSAKYLSIYLCNFIGTFVAIFLEVKNGLTLTALKYVCINHGDRRLS